MTDNRADYAEILQQILSGASASNVLNLHLNDSERNFCNMLFMTTLRKLIFIKDDVLPRFIKKKIARKQQILEYILYLGTTELLFMNTPDYAVVNSYTEAAKHRTDQYGANFVNAVLRNILRQKDTLLKLRQDKYFSRDFIKILKQDYQPEDIAAMEMFAQFEPALDISLKDSASARPDGGLVLPDGSIRFPSNTKVTQLAGYTNGDWWVQDAAAAMAVKTLKDIRDKDVLDLCAAPGGKTAQLLAAGATVTAVDISEKRLSTLRENMNRLKLTENLTIICADALSYQPQKKFDVILLDAPCSATGTYRRHPEIMHTKTIGDVKKQALLQKEILEHCAEMVVSKGILLYVTCSLAKEEGERQINRFVSKHSEFSIIPINNCGTDKMRTKEGYLRILPQYFESNTSETENSGCDGFFIAQLQRNI